MAIYLDNAATSFPKPPQVGEAMAYYLTKVGATIHRASYAPAQEAELTALSLRKRLCRLLGCGSRPNHAILTGGCTMGLNLILQGYLRPGDHCLVDSAAHNAVLRPLREMGISFDKIPCDSAGFLDPQDILPLIRPNTRLLLLTHGSNVSGSVQDAAAVGRICKEQGLAFAMDCAQTAGHVAVDFDGFGCDAMAVPAHKGLLGPSGIGALLLTPDFAKNLRPLLWGGTGSASHLETQPLELPDRFEAGTPNLPGIYGWEAALGFLEEVGISRIRQQDLRLSRRFLWGISQIPQVRLVGSPGPENRVAVFSLDFPGQDNGLICDRLEQEFGILTRSGLHCAPSAHQALGTYPQGTVRFSFGWYNTEEDVDKALEAIAAMGR